MAAGRQDVDGIWQGITENYRRVAASPADYSATRRGRRAPPAWDTIHPDEAVLDLGCGAGLDVLVAAQIVGPMGRVAGVGLSPHMLAVAGAGLVKIGCSQGVLCEAAIEARPFPAGYFDVAISSGVLNLDHDKPAALREVLRVPRPGGRLQACDVGLVGKEPPAGTALWYDSIAGAVARKVFLAMLEGAGFAAIRCAGPGEYRTSAHTRPTYYTARKPET